MLASVTIHDPESLDTTKQFYRRTFKFRINCLHVDFEVLENDGTTSKATHAGKLYGNKDRVGEPILTWLDDSHVRIHHGLRELENGLLDAMHKVMDPMKKYIMAFMECKKS